MFAVNQIIEYRYKMTLLQAPCNLCLDTRPELKSCFVNIPKINVNLTKYFGETINISLTTNFSGG